MKPEFSSFIDSPGHGPEKKLQFELNRLKEAMQPIIKSGKQKRRERRMQQRKKH